MAASPVLHLRARLSPERLGRPTTISVSFGVTYPTGAVPLPLTAMDLRLPAGLSLSTSELGLSTCRLPALEARPLHGCPPNSLIGLGEATAVVPFGSRLIPERVAISLYAGPLSGGAPTVLATASGSHPVIADIVFGGRIAQVPRPFEGSLDLTMPIVPGLPEGPAVALVSMRSTIGPRGILYSERLHGHTIRFHPKGLVLPRRCPHGGFPFALALTFADGSHAFDRTAVACPTRRATPRPARFRGRSAARRSAPPSLPARPR